LPIYDEWLCLAATVGVSPVSADRDLAQPGAAKPRACCCGAAFTG
jgi:hypothetical protein